MTRLCIFLSRTIRVFLWVIGGLIFFRYLFRPLLPFLLAFGFCTVTEPFVVRLQGKLRGKRTPAALLTITLVLLLLLLAASLLFLPMIIQLGDLIDGLSESSEDIPRIWNGFLEQLSLWYRGSSPYVRQSLDVMAELLTSEGHALVSHVSRRLAASASHILSSLPDILLSLGTTMLAVYFTGVSYPSILSFLKRQLPESIRCRCRKTAYCFRTTVWRWIRAESLLMAVTFLFLLLGFLLLRIRLALLAAGAIALIDALPILGTGTILIPWAVILFILGNTGKGTALLILYACITVTRSILEPKLLAATEDLPPIAALMALFIGYRCCGIGGMLLFPILLMLICQLQAADVIHLWK